jgi:hypothetical protein
MQCGPRVSTLCRGIAALHKPMAMSHTSDGDNTQNSSKRRPPMCAAGHLPAFSTAGSAAAAVPHCASYAASAALPIPVTGPAATFAASNAVDQLKTLRGGLERLAAAEAEGAEGAVEAEREVDVVPARCWRPDLPPVRIARARWDRCWRACKLCAQLSIEANEIHQGKVKS